MHKVQVIRSPSGEEPVVLSRADYEALLAASSYEEEDDDDVALYDARKRELAEGGDVALPAEVSALLLKSNSRLRAVRLWRGLTQVDLAEKVGIAQGYLSEIESGAKGCSVETLTALARVLDVPERWIG